VQHFGQYLAHLMNEFAEMLHYSQRLPTNYFAAGFGVLVTGYFWWSNIKGIHESSGKALRIMQITTVMVVAFLIWCPITMILMPHVELPPLPKPSNLQFSPDALGWFRGTVWPQIGAVAILIAFGHSLLSMSGFETLAQVYREIAYPKMKNLRYAGNMVCIYAQVCTGVVTLMAVMIIPDSVRDSFFDNPIGGLAMYLTGPVLLRLIFRAFIVVVGVLMLAGAVNTAIVGSNGVLNRVSEDGILPHWFRVPHRRFGTSSRILNLVVGLQIITILLSRGDIFVLGEAYAFGVMWSFAMKGLAVLVLRYKQPGKREFRVPFNLKVGKIEIPIGLGLVTLTLVALCVINLFTKRVATMSGLAFTIIFFAVFTITEKITKHRASAHTELDQFNLEAGDDLTPATLGVRPGNILVMVRNYNTLNNLSAVLDRVDPRKHDVVALHLRFLTRSGSGESDLAPEQLFSLEEQELFTRALNLAEKKGKTIHLAVAAASEKWDAILRAAQSLQSSAVVLGASPTTPVNEEARVAGLAWEKLADPKPQLSLEIHYPTGQDHVFYLGPHAPHLTPKEIDLLHRVWLEVSCDVAPEEIHHHDVIHFALQELEQELSNSHREVVMAKLREHLQQIKDRRVPRA
jgi:amino acid transporter